MKLLLAMTLLLGTLLGSAPARIFTVPKKLLSSSRRNCEYLLSLDEEEMLAIIPLQSGIFFSDCPNCDGGAQDRGNWHWDPKKPKQLKCRNCGEVYPGNSKYPDTDYHSVPAPRGEHRYHYYERPKDNYRIYLRAHADYLACRYMEDRCRDLARCYAITGEEGYALRATLILKRFAEVYPGYAFKFDYPFRQKLFSPWNDDEIPGIGAYRVSKWTWWAYMDVSQDLLEAYDALRFWPGLTGKDRVLIENDLLGSMMNFVIGIPETYTNMSPGMWVQFIFAGRLLERNDWINESINRVMRFVGSQFLYDGHWHETAPSYCQQVIGAMNRIVAALDGYQPPADDTTLAKKLLEMQTVIQSLKAAAKASRRPDQTFFPVNDTWVSPGPVTGKTTSRMLPGLGLLVLGGGEGKQQFTVCLNNTGGAGHKHADALSISLFANEKELLRDLGYTHTAWRAWTIATASHNTVMIDGLNGAFDKLHRHNRTLAFASDRRGFHLAMAENTGFYPGIARRYRRTILAVGNDSRNAYVVDLFQVHGGNRHDWLLHGSACEDSTATVQGAPLAPFAGTLMPEGATFAYPEAESASLAKNAGLGFITNLQRGKAEGQLILDLRLSSKPKTGTRTWIVPGETAEVFLGESPRIRQAERHDQLLKKYMAPSFCIRRTGENLQSAFLAVHEPTTGELEIRKMETKRFSNGVVLTITRRSGIDFVIIGDEDAFSASMQTPAGDLEFNTHWGVVRLSNGAISEMHLLDGKEIILGKNRISAGETRRGEVRDWLQETGPDSRGWIEIPETNGTIDNQVALLLEFADKTIRPFTIAGSQKAEHGTRIFVKEAPAFKRNGNTINFTSYPIRSVDGSAIRYTLYSSAHLYPAGKQND